MHWYQKTALEVLSEFSVDPEAGLKGDQIRERVRTFGLNLLAQKKQDSIFDLFIRQFESPLVYILFIAAVLVLFLGDLVDALVIMAVIAINSIVGTIQEGRARNSLERLRTLTRHKALVRRGREEVLIWADELVPGDILILKEGDRVGADARIIKGESLRVDEAVLTGEAYSVEKISGVLKKDGLTCGDQKNMLFAGTSVVSGYAEAVVVATGMASELGKISKEVLEASSVPLPLAKKVEELTHFIAIAVLVIAIAVFIIGILRGIETREMLSVVIGMIVSLVPEGLPVAVTIVLARGVWRMAKAKAIVRQMAAVEAMGNADTLLVDKTGTITSGKMVIRKVLFDGQTFDVSGDGYEPKGDIKSNSKLKTENSKLKELLGLVYLSLKADVVHEEHGGWKASGDSTEVAIAVLARKLGLARDKLESEFKTVFANPFDQQKRYIEGAFTKKGKKFHVFVGAPDYISKSLKVDHGFAKDYHDLAKSGLRVVGVAVFSAGKRRLLGSALLAIDEEIRHEVFQSIEEAQKTGFRVVMLTGDYPETAREISRKVGIYKEGDKVLTGEDVEKLSAKEIALISRDVAVFARITPEHKMKIVHGFQAAGRVVAMTGDGVNDAPALQAANLGIAIGSGTQVAKDSSDIVLVDSNFETIVRSISEGRAIYLTLKKVILYLFSTSFGEVLVLAGAILIGLPLPLVAVQIIWLNFVTDGFFVAALAQQKPKEGLISREETESDNLVDRMMVTRIITMGISMGTALPVFYYFLNNYSLDYARTMALLVLSATQWFNSLNVRSRNVSIFRKGMDNPYLVASFVAVFILQYLIIETGWGNKILHTTNLSIEHWLLAIGVATTVIWIEEIRKLLAKKG